jgi:photosystem II stability/assembly factor-like uncharacterized protein
MNSYPIKLVKALPFILAALLLTAAAPQADDSAQLYLVSPVVYEDICAHLSGGTDLLFCDRDLALIRSVGPLNPMLFSAGSHPLLIDEAPADIYYLLVSDPLGLGEENLAQFGRIVAGFPREKGYLLAALSPDCTWLNATGYDAFPLFPQKPSKISAPPQTPQYSALIPLALNSFGDGEGYKWLEKMASFQTRFTYTDQLNVAANYLCGFLTNLGYSVTIESYDFDLINWSQYHEIDFTPDHSQGYLVCRDGFIFSTLNLGDSFERQDVKASPYAVWALDDEHLYIAGGAGKVGFSADGGASWQITVTPTESTLYGIDFCNPQDGIACGTEGAIVYTRDGGQSWQVGASGVVSDLVCIHQLSPDVALCGGKEGKLLKTDDGGASWQNICPPELADYNIRDFSFINSSEGWLSAGLYGVGGIIAHTTDGGDTWTVQSQDSVDLISVSFSDALNGWAGGQVGVIKHTTDGGASWQTLSFPSQDHYITDLYALNPQRVLVSCIYGPHYITTDGGVSWQELNLGEAGILPRPNIVATKYGEIYPDEEVILVAHFDSISDDPWTLAPGADDNGSGDAEVLLSAEALTRFDLARTVKFLLVSGEEQGLRGSMAYAQSAYNTGENIVAVVNADMIAYKDDQNEDFEVRDTAPWEWMGDYVQKVAGFYLPQLTIIPHYTGAGGSDHMSFWNFGYPALMIGEYPGTAWYPYYHTTHDLPEYLSAEMQALGSKLALATAMSLAEPLAIHPQNQPSPGPFAAPNPYRADGSAPGVCFANLTGYDTLRIYDVSGAEVYSCQLGGANSLLWQAVNNNSQEVASGVYLWLVEGKSQPTVTGKIAVIR